VVLGVDPTSQLTRVRVGRGELDVPRNALATGSALRIQLLARDIIVSTQIPANLSIRNSLVGMVTHVQSDDTDSDLITIDIGTAQVMARIPKAATRELALRPGMQVWALVKSVSLRGRSFTASTSVVSLNA
jgi:molybdate transport system ATP-binding protein